MRRSVAIAVILAGLSASASGETGLPEGCGIVADGFLCEWDHDTSAGRADDPAAPMGGGFQSEIPVRGSMIATVTVRMEGRMDIGWNVFLYQITGEGESTQIHMSRSAHNAPTDGGEFHSATSIFLVERAPLIESEHYLQLAPGNVEVGGSEMQRGGQFSSGDYHVVYEALSLPEGSVPSRPAATAEDPHVLDSARDARRAELDLLAAWLDDARIGDKLFEMHLRVANLSDIQLRRIVNNDEGSHVWRFPVTVGGESYVHEWFAERSSDGSIRMGCHFDRLEGQNTPVVGFPVCTFDVANATMHAAIPEGFIGTPGTGVPVVPGRVYSATSSGSLDTIIEDEAAGKVYDFALGGPAVWSALNPRLDPVVAQAAWYQDPLATDNIPDTLSVAGALLAALTFLAGLVVVQRNRRRTREILERVDALVRAHEADSRAALRALGDLESDFDRLYRERRINETQYQMAQQRIVAAASRLALRKELGLDDGRPG